jgi:hypothetical protein
MKNRNIYLYIAGACFFAMCGSLWNEFVASDKSHLNLVLRASDGAERSERNPGSHLNPESLNPETRYYAVPKTAVESFPFDPNEADSTQLLRLGLTPAQVRSIYRHRAKGYVYSTPEDFARTPFMTKGQWNHLKPLIKIGDQYKPVKIDSMFNVQGSTSRLSEGRPKLVSGLPSDSDVCGAQPRIVYSQHSNKPNAEKLAYSAEARRMSMDEIHELSIINLNESSFKDLVHHPFLSYDQVKAVKNFQRKYGRIRNMTELLILPEFTVEDTLRLSPYLQF